MKTKFTVVLTILCILIVAYASIIAFTMGPEDILNPAGILYFPSIVIQLVANEGNGIVCVDACGPCSAWGPYHVLVNDTCVLPDVLPTPGIITLEIIPTFDYEIEKGDVTYGSQYQISGGIIDNIVYDENSNSLIISLDESEKGYIQILIQIGLLHSIDQSPFTYTVIVDEEEVTFDQLSPIFLKIPFDKGTRQIEIIGTNRI